jgi:hypothetical protein
MEPNAGKETSSPRLWSPGKKEFHIKPASNCTHPLLIFFTLSV